jgi:hypothetical protein
MSKTKFNKFENYFITNALEHAIIQAEDDILELLDEGKTPIFASGYFNLIGEEIKEKINYMTLKEEIKTSA